MAERIPMPSALTPARIKLKTYVAELPLGTLAVGVDNIHHDVFLSPKFVESTGTYLLDFIRQSANLTFLSQTDRMGADRRQTARRDNERRPSRSSEAQSWKRHLSELLHA